MTYAGGAAPSHQSGLRYRTPGLPVRDISDGNAIDDITVDQTTYTAFFDTYPEGDLWWRVQAIDAKGNRLAWSDTRKFTKATPAATSTRPTGPSTQAPSRRSTATSARASSRSAGRRTLRRDLEDRGLQGRRHDAVRGQRVAVDHVEAGRLRRRPPSLPPSDLPYRWRIIRYDATGDENKGRWSDLGRFWVDPAPVTLAARRRRGQPPNGVVLTWDPYARASCRPPSTPSTSATRATRAWARSPHAATALAPTVTSRTAPTAGRSRRSTPATTRWAPARPGHFVVDTALSAGHATQIQAPDGTEVGKTLTSTAPAWNQPGVANTYQWLRNGSNISGATGADVRDDHGRRGKAISPPVTGKLPGYTDGVEHVERDHRPTGAAPMPTDPADHLRCGRGPGDAHGNLGHLAGQPDATYQWFVNGRRGRQGDQEHVRRAHPGRGPARIRSSDAIR